MNALRCSISNIKCLETTSLLEFNIREFNIEAFGMSLNCMFIVSLTERRSSDIHEK